MSDRNVHQPDSNISEIWNEVSRNYNWNNYWKGCENIANLKVLLKHIGDPKGKAIIEMGSGSGFTSALLAAKGAVCSLLDISKDSLEIAAEAFRENKLPEPACVLGDALNSGLDSNSFDVAWNGGVIEHFADPGKEQLIREMHRIAKPGGAVIVLVPNSNCFQFQLVQKWMKMRGTWPYGFEDDMSPARLKRMALKLGFLESETYAFNSTVGWRWLPGIGPRLTSLLKMENLERHMRKSSLGYVSVLVIRK